MLRRILVGVALGLLACAVLASAGARAGFVSVPFERPDGPGSWLLSRAAGVAAYVALTAEILLGLCASTGALDRWISRASAGQIHRWLSSVALALVAAHALVLVCDRYVAFDLLDALVPFVAGERRTAVGLGATAAWLAVVVHASFAMRSRIGPKAWRRLHYVSFAVFVLATLHGLAAGSDRGDPALLALYVASALSVVALTVRRVVGAPDRPARGAERSAC